LCADRVALPALYILLYMRAGLLSDVARSGVNASGRARARARRSSPPLAPPPARPRDARDRQHVGKIVERRGQIGRERLRTRLRQSATNVHRLLRRRQRVLATPERRQIVPRIVKIRHLCRRFGRSFGHDQSDIRREIRRGKGMSLVPTAANDAARSGLSVTIRTSRSSSGCTRSPSGRRERSV
jgi:hypothetical protein